MPPGPTLSPEEEDDIRNVIGESAPPGLGLLLKSKAEPGNSLKGEGGVRCSNRFIKKGKWSYALGNDQF